MDTAPRGVGSRSGSGDLNYNPYSEDDLPELPSVADAVSPEHYRLLAVRSMLLASRRRREHLTAMTYHEYTRSQEWQAVRAYILGRLVRCQLCGSEKERSLHVHHFRYRDRLIELFNPEESLTAICDKCHDQFHVGKRVLEEARKRGGDCRFSDQRASGVLISELVQFGVTFTAWPTVRIAAKALDMALAQIVFCDACGKPDQGRTQAGRLWSTRKCCGEATGHTRSKSAWFGVPTHRTTE